MCHADWLTQQVRVTYSPHRGVTGYEFDSTAMLTPPVSPEQRIWNHILLPAARRNFIVLLQRLYTLAQGSTCVHKAVPVCLIRKQPQKKIRCQRHTMHSTGNESHAAHPALCKLDQI